MAQRLRAAMTRFKIPTDATAPAAHEVVHHVAAKARVTAGVGSKRW